jgi:hypothetical protein
MLMMKGLRARFWIEGGMAMVTAMLFLVTLVQRDWIESLFGIDPDRYSGSLEWTIVGALLVVTVALFALAGREWRRATVAA